jgi:Tol biopolymer transport system component
VVEGDPTANFPLRNKVGTNGDDVLAGTDGADLIEGKGGSDKLDGGAGDDELEGDGASLQGSDTLIGGGGDDRLAGRAGNDRLFGDSTESGSGGGNDELVGGSGRDLLVGGGGNDALMGAYDGDRILAGAGNDAIGLLGGDTTDPNGTVYVDCGPGTDTVVINPARRGTYRNCEYFADQWHEADSGQLLRPSPEVFPVGSEPAARASAFAVTREAEADGATGPPSISYDGNRVAFSSDASNLIESDTNGERTDPYVRDLAGKQTLVGDPTRDGLAYYGGRFRRGPSGALSGDGRFAVFSSRSSDLGRSGSGYRIWVRDLQDGSTRIACRSGNAALENPVISADGRRVAFETLASNLAGSDTNQQVDVYWCDLASGELRRVSTPVTDGVNTSGTSLDPSISADGRFVAYSSDSGVFWKDMDTGETRQVDRPGDLGMHPRISADGNYVAYDSEAGQVVRRDMPANVFDVVTETPGSTVGSISADGNVVAYSSTDVYTRNFANGQVTQVSSDGRSYAPAVSGDGRFVAFASRAAGGRAGIYRKDLDTGAVDLVSVGLDLAPRTLIDAPLGKLPRRKARTITGTAQDDGTVARVDVSMSRSIGKGRCLWLGPRSRVIRGRCARPVWVATRLDGGLRFSLKIRRLLPRGTWRLRTRATDAGGTDEPARSGSNLIRVRLV